MNNILKKILSEMLKFIIKFSLGMIWITTAMFFVFGLGEENYILGFIIMLVILFSPILITIYFNKKIREQWLKEGKDFIIGTWYLIIIVGVLLGVLAFISLIFITFSTMFYWLAGLSVTTLLALILIVLVLK